MCVENLRVLHVSKNACVQCRVLWIRDTLYKPTDIWQHCTDKASHLPDFAWDRSPHLLVTPVQLMRPGIGWNTFCTACLFPSKTRTCLDNSIPVSDIWFQSTLHSVQKNSSMNFGAVFSIVPRLSPLRRGRAWSILSHAWCQAGRAWEQGTLFLTVRCNLPHPHTWILIVNSVLL